MSKRVVIKGHPMEVAGVLVKVDQECMLPDGLAEAMEAKGLCVIVTKLDRKEGIETKIDSPKANKARKKAAATKKARAAGKKKAAQK